MTEIDKLNHNGSGRGGEGDCTAAPEIVRRIRGLVEGQHYGVLCTQIDGQPYGSMIALAFTEDLCYAVFSTPKATRKYRNLTGCNNVAIVVNNLDRFPNELMKVEAFTITGRAVEIVSEQEHSRWSALLAGRHPRLKSFIESPSTAILKVAVVRFVLVHSFQDVTQWSPSSGTGAPPPGDC